MEKFKEFLKKKYNITNEDLYKVRYYLKTKKQKER